MSLPRLSALLFVMIAAASGCAHRSAVVPGAGGMSGAPAGLPAASADQARNASGPAQAGVDRADETADEAGPGEGPSAALGEIADPLAPWNRAMFAFNDGFYFLFLKPVARGYRAVVPRIGRTGVDNFFHNLTTPGRLVSDLFQLKGREAAIELGKFMINSTWGVLGFGDWFAANPAAKIPDGDFGLALGHYGVGNGMYIVWPFLGPSTLRDSVGMVGDVFLDPTAHVRPLSASAGIYTFKQVNTTSFRIGDYEAIKDAAIDPYIAVRQAYIQHRERAIDTYEPYQNFIFP
jgi:phospholipid-binding lipoprotein MlaA